MGVIIVTPSLPSSQAPSARRLPDTPGAQATIIARAGDTLTSIAARVYGDPTLFVELCDENDIRDPRSIKPGMVLRLLP